MSSGLSTEAGAVRKMLEDELQPGWVTEEGVRHTDGQPLAGEAFFRMMLESIRDYATFALDARGRS
ncbi:MAG: hypothetical protein M3416_00060 [Acidobacteriota bacterium]|nr:hypothetical protein [Acidobacteriota bacterium]